MSSQPQAGQPPASTQGTSLLPGGWQQNGGNCCQSSCFDPPELKGGLVCVHRRKEYAVTEIPSTPRRERHYRA